MMMPRKKRRMIVVSIILAILIMIGAIFLVIYNTTDTFKANNVLFEKYAKQLLENLDDVFNEDHMVEMEEILKNNKLTSEIIASINYNEDGDTSNPINNVQVNISGEQEKATGYDYKDINVTQNGETVAGVEYIENGEIAGIRLNGIRQYLSTNIHNESENEIANLYQLIHTDIQEVFAFNTEEWKTLKEKYVGIIWANLINATFSKQTGIGLKINGTQYNTNMYSVTITKEQFNYIYMQVLEELKKDEILLAKLEALDNQFNQYHNFVQDEETSNMKQDFIEEMDNTIQKIQDSNIGNDERTISVFESNGVAISLSIDTEENFVGLDIVNGEGTNFINLLGNEKVKDEEKENRFDLKIEKTKATNDETIAINYTIVEEGKEIVNECYISRKMENSKVNSNVKFSRSVEQNTLEVLMETTTNIVNGFEEREELVENENNIIIEKLNVEQEQSVISQVKTNIENQINSILQKVSLENLNQILVNMKLMEEELEELSGDGNVTELEKNRFNSNFQLFEGEKVTKERVEELITIAKEDLADIRITNYREQNEKRIPLEYRLVIERGKENTQLAENIIGYIEENYTGDFSVRLEYDETTGLVSNIYITVLED